MGSFKGPQGGPVALARDAQSLPEFVLDLGCRPPVERLLEPTLERQHGVREWRVGAPRLALPLDQRGEPLRGIAASGGDGDTGLRHLLLEPLEQRARSLAHLEQAVPLAHGAVVAAKGRAHLRVDHEHEPVEEAAPLRRWPGEKAIHGRNEPHEPDVVGECAWARVLAGDADRPPGTLLVRSWEKPRADLDLALRRDYLRRDGKAARAVFAAKLVIGTPAQAVTGAEQGNRLEQVGLARAVVADQHHGLRPERKPRAGIVAEIGELELLDE